jgi:hypothetical protein
MILPDTEAGVWHAKRRVTALTDLKRKNTTKTAALFTWKANRSGIIRLTLTA